MKKVLQLIAIAVLFPFFSHAQNWTQKTGLENKTRHHPVTWAIDGFGYSVTGSTPSQSVTKHFFKYNPQTDSWEQLEDFPGTARSYSIGGTYQGKGYLGFGSSASAVLKDLWKYDPATGEWEQLASCPCSGRQHPTFTVNEEHGKIYVGQGNNASGNLGDWWEYDIATNTWAQKEDFPGTDRHHPYFFSLDGYSYSGFGDDHTGNYATDDFYRYDVETDSWTEVDGAPDGIGRIAGTQFSYGGYGFAMDGDGAYHNPTNSIFWKYDPAADDWEVLTPHPGVSLWAPGSFILEGTVYIIGGVDRSGPNDDYFEGMWAFDLNSVMGTSDVDDKLALQVYPNPAEQYLNIKMNENSDQYFASVYDISGKLVLNAVFKSSEFKLNLESFNSGVYFIRIKTSKGKEQISKFVKK